MPVYGTSFLVRIFTISGMCVMGTSLPGSAGWSGRFTGWMPFWCLSNNQLTYDFALCNTRPLSNSQGKVVTLIRWGVLVVLVVLHSSRYSLQKLKLYIWTHQKLAPKPVPENWYQFQFLTRLICSLVPNFSATSFW